MTFFGFRQVALFCFFLAFLSLALPFGGFVLAQTAPLGAEKRPKIESFQRKDFNFQVNQLKS